MSVIAPRARPAPRAAPARWPLAVAVAATAISAALVLFELGTKSLWYDEAYGIGTIDRPFGDALWRLAHWEVNQAPFNLLLAGWWRLDQSETFLRLLPALCAVAAVPALFALGRRLLGAEVGAVAALLLAVHPLVVQWGQQLRAYSLVVLLVILATALLLRALDRPDATGPAVTYALVAALATYTHFFGGLVVGAHAAWLLTGRPRPRRLLVVAGAAYVVLVAPLLAFLATRKGDPLYWVSDRTGSALVEAASTLGGGSHWGVAAYAATGAAGLWATYERLRSPDQHGHPPALLPVLWLVVPVALVLASTVTVKPLLEGRFLIVVVPALVLVAATGVVRLGNRLGPLAVVALLVASGLGLHEWYSTPSHEDWRSAVRVVDRVSPPGAPVVVVPWGGVFAVRYYEGRLATAAHPVVRPQAGDPPEGTALVEIRRLDDGGQPAPLEPGYRAWRDRHYAQTGEHRVEKLVVRTFERR